MLEDRRLFQVFSLVHVRYPGTDAGRLAGATSATHQLFRTLQNLCILPRSGTCSERLDGAYQQRRSFSRNAEDWMAQPV